MKSVRVPFDEFVATLDLGQCVELYEQAAATRGELPCERIDPRRCEGKEPDAHQTCRDCFSWRDCTDPDCDHPACGRGVSFHFREAWLAATDSKVFDLDVLMSRGDPAPLLEYGRMSVLVDDVKPNEKMGAKILAALTAKQGIWQQLYDMRLGSDATEWLPGEVWLAKQKNIAVEVTEARYQTPVWVAFEAGRGHLEETEGGLFVHEFRLAQPVDLADAPALTQGALW